MKNSNEEKIMPTPMITQTETTTYYSDGSAKRKTYEEVEDVRNRFAIESEEETITCYTDDSEEDVDLLMAEAEVAFLEQEIAES